MKNSGKTSSNRLGTYLTATVGTSLLAAVQSDAAIVNIDIGPSGFNIAGPNGNVQLGYGWLEVRWTGSTNQFQILAGAYEDQVGVPILTPTAIPEPASALSTMGMLASGLLIRRRKLAA